MSANLVPYQASPRTASVIAQFEKSVQAVSRKAEKAIEKHESVVEGTISELSAGTAAFATGVYQGKSGGHNFFGIPAELYAYAALKGLGMWFDGWVGNVFRSAGTGVGTALTARWGHSVGKDWKEKAEKEAGTKPPTTNTSAGNEHEAGRVGMRLSDAELRNMYDSM
jgi:hypothetical protein